MVRSRMRSRSNSARAPNTGRPVRRRWCGCPAGSYRSATPLLQLPHRLDEVAILPLTRDHRGDRTAAAARVDAWTCWHPGQDVQLVGPQPRRPVTERAARLENLEQLIKPRKPDGRTTADDFAEYGFTEAEIERAALWLLVCKRARTEELLTPENTPT